MTKMSLSDEYKSFSVNFQSDYDVRMLHFCCL